MSDQPDHEQARDLSPQKLDAPLYGTRPSRTPVYPAAVYQCESPEHAQQLLGEIPTGYAYQRDGHPNADVVAEKVRLLHNAERAVLTSSGQSALATILLSQLERGDQVILSSRLYGGTSVLVKEEAVRLGIEWTEVDTTDLSCTAATFGSRTKLLIVETIANPTLNVANIGELARLCHQADSLLVVDNTFATPIICRPLDLGADIVMESMTKFMNGHGDVMLGAICGGESVWERIPRIVSKWGFAASPFDCWLAERGLETLYVRMAAASEASLEISNGLLAIKSGIERIDYPGLPDQVDHSLAVTQFAKNRTGQTLFGNILTLHLPGGLSAARSFIERCKGIPYCPSLGETVTTLSHPASSSHRNLDENQLQELGMSSGTIRFSIGLESPEFVVRSVVDAI